MPDLRSDTMRKLMSEVIIQLAEPEFSGHSERSAVVVEGTQPAVRVSSANCPLDFDPWKGLRNPAVVGLHPVGFEQLWEYYAHHTVQNTDADGRPTIFQVPESYDAARQRFGRVVIMSVMLPVSTGLAQEYAASIRQGNQAPLDRYRSFSQEINRLLDQAVTRLAYRIMHPGRVVLAMNKRTVTAATEHTVPPARRGSAHGAGIPANYSQKSLAVLTGLGQFGANHLIIRDEVTDGSVQRLIGPVRSLVVFDSGQPQHDAGMRLLTESWRDWLFRLHSGDEELNTIRFCGYFAGGDRACADCIEACPSGAIANSIPTPGGGYSAAVARQPHRFWDGRLRFDYRSCQQSISRMEAVYGEWICARCLAVCAGSRSVSAAAAKAFQEAVLTV